MLRGFKEFNYKPLGFVANDYAIVLWSLKEVKEITKGNGVSVVYDGVGKNTFDGSIECLKTRGMMVSFGNASGPLDPVFVLPSHTGVVSEIIIR